MVLFLKAFHFQLVSIAHKTILIMLGKPGPTRALLWWKDQSLDYHKSDLYRRKLLSNFFKTFRQTSTTSSMVRRRSSRTIFFLRISFGVDRRRPSISRLVINRHFTFFETGNPLIVLGFPIQLYSRRQFLTIQEFLCLFFRKEAKLHCHALFTRINYRKNYEHTNLQSLRNSHQPNGTLYIAEICHSDSGIVCLHLKQFYFHIKYIKGTGYIKVTFEYNT